MGKIGQATTPTFIYTVPDGFDVSEIKNVYFALTQSGRRIVKSGESIDISNTEIKIYLTQEDTLNLSSTFPAQIQLNWTYPDGKRGMTPAMDIMVARNLIPEVLT